MSRLLVIASLTFFALGATSASAAPPEKWGKYCAKCHGDDGKGKTKMGEMLKISDMTSADWQKKFKDADLKKVTREGNKKKKMPSFSEKKLSDADIGELVKYMRSLKK